MLARYNRCIHGPITAGVTQWTRGFLRDSAGQIGSLLRSEQPLGMHVHYEQFRFRNQVINTLAQHYPDTVGFQTGYHDISDSERMRRWCAHKAHWTVPVLNDIPIRIFDALSTGGVAIVADSLKHLPIISALAEHFVFYRATDIVEPRAIVEEANRKFDAGGLEKVLERHRLGVEHHHVSTRIERILQTVFDEFELPKSARKI